jgi:hypothetical protein
MTGTSRVGCKYLGRAHKAAEEELGLLPRPQVEAELEAAPPHHLGLALHYPEGPVVNRNGRGPPFCFASTLFTPSIRGRMSVDVRLAFAARSASHSNGCQ